MTSDAGRYRTYFPKLSVIALEGTSTPDRATEVRGLVKLTPSGREEIVLARGRPSAKREITA